MMVAKKPSMRQWVDRYSDLYVMGDESNGLSILENYDDAIVGVCHRGDETFIVYDYGKVIAKIAEDMTTEEAEEWFDVNVAPVADSAPHRIGFLRTPQNADIDVEDDDDDEEGIDAPSGG